MSGNEFVLVCAGRSYTASARLVFRDLGKQFSLSDNVINMIHERYMDLVHEHSMVLVPIHAALARAWVKKTLRVPITFGMEEVLLQDKRGHEQDASNAAKAARNAAASSSNVEMASRNVMGARRILHEQKADDIWGDFAYLLENTEERLAQAIQRAARDAAADKFLNPYPWATELAERATEVARIGRMVKMPHWVKVVVEFS